MSVSGVGCLDIPVAYSRSLAHNENWENGYMSANVSVMGGVGLEEYGLEFSQEVQVKHNKDVADKLLNISGIGTKDGQKAHMSAQRPPYVHQEYPKLLYKPIPGEKGEFIVRDVHEHQEAVAAGWREAPYPKPQIAVLDPEREKKALLDQNEKLQAQILVQQEQMDKLQAMMGQLLNAQSQEATETVRRGPGRPPKSSFPDGD